MRLQSKKIKVLRQGRRRHGHCCGVSGSVLSGVASMVVLLSLVISAGIGAAALLVIWRTVARENAAAMRELDRL